MYNDLKFSKLNNSKITHIQDCRESDAPAVLFLNVILTLNLSVSLRCVIGLEEEFIPTNWMGHMSCVCIV